MNEWISFRFFPPSLLWSVEQNIHTAASSYIASFQLYFWPTSYWWTHHIYYTVYNTIRQIICRQYRGNTMMTKAKWGISVALVVQSYNGNGTKKFLPFMDEFGNAKLFEPYLIFYKILPQLRKQSNLLPLSRKCHGTTSRWFCFPLRPALLTLCFAGILK